MTSTQEKDGTASRGKAKQPAKKAAAKRVAKKHAVVTIDRSGKKPVVGITR